TNSDLKQFAEVLEKVNTLSKDAKKDKEGKAVQTDEFKILKDKLFTIAGIITVPADTNLMTKTGKPFGRFTIEDFTGNREISLFGDSFEQYKNLLNRKNQYLLIKVQAWRPSWREDADYELKINSIELLSEVLEKYTRRIDLTVNLNNISSQLVDNLKQTIMDNPGKAPLYLQVVTENNEVLHLKSPSKINPKDFMHATRSYKDIGLRLVK
ncbi:MAG: hypothetical protein KAH25_01265, partial [Bacteroidales bacterium]|nr:hypothetical protein [Bacteroidales bacterium]